MKLTPLKNSDIILPAELEYLATGAKLYDSSCSPEAKVIFVDKDGGYFIKSAPKATLARETAMIKYFNSKGLSAEVLTYISDEKDWLVTRKIIGDDCTTAKYIYEPEKLCDIFAEQLALLHALDYADCPIQNHTTLYLASAQRNYLAGTYDKSHFPDSFGYKTPEEAWAVVKSEGHMLQATTLLHGDYCLPNVILDNWNFSGFIDLDNGGVGDRHVDIFWGIWTLAFNLKTDKYCQRFKDAYGRNNINEDILRIVSAIEVFG